VNGTGTTKNNGATNHYTGYINHGEYSSISLGNAHRTDDANFIVEVMCQDTEDDYQKHAQVTVESDLGDAPIKFFTDPDLFAGEPGIGVQVYKTYSKSFEDSTQQAVGFSAPDANMVHYKVSLGVPNTECQTTSMHEHLIWPPTAYDSFCECQRPFFCGVDACKRLYDIENSSMWLYTRLWGGFDWWGGDGFKNRLCGLRRGGYWFASYGGKALDTGILNSGEYAMELSKNSGTYTWKMFETGQVSITNACSSGNGINLGACSAICAIGWAVMGTGPWAVAFGVASGVAALIEAVDTDTGIDYRAEGAVYIRYITDTFPSVHVEAESTAGSEAWSANGTFGISKPVVENNINWVAGDCYTLIVDLESASCAKTAGWSSYQINDYSVFGCAGNASISAGDDFGNWTLMVRCP
jgi:hypothetical protein